MGSKLVNGPRSGIRGGTDYELPAGAEQRSGSSDDRRWWPEAAGSYEIGLATVLLVFTEDLGGTMEDGHTV